VYLTELNLNGNSAFTFLEVDIWKDGGLYFIQARLIMQSDFTEDVGLRRIMYIFSCIICHQSNWPADCLASQKQP
jgi:hypothetical protein